MAGRGTAYRKRHLEGAKLTPGQAIAAKCSDCMCDYTDGRVDCGIKLCPLYPWMPYTATPREKRVATHTTRPPRNSRVEKVANKEVLGATAEVR